MNYLKYTLNLFYFLIKNNITKSIFLAIAIFCFFLAGTFKDQTDTYRVIQTTQVGNSYLYTYESSGEFKILKSDKKEIVLNGFLTRKSYNDANVLFWCGFGIISLVLLILFFMGLGDDDQLSWEFDMCSEEAFSLLIYCEEENGKFYYFVGNKLIAIRDSIADQKYCTISRELGITSFEKLRSCPMYVTKKKRRERILNEILP